MSSSGCRSGRRPVWSYAISTSRGKTSEGQHHAGGVVPERHGSTRGAGIGSFRERQCVLGSRSARRAVHGGVRGVHRPDLPLVLAAHLDRGRLRRADRGIGGLLGSGGLGEEFRAGMTTGDRFCGHVPDNSSRRRPEPCPALTDLAQGTKYYAVIPPASEPALAA